MDQNMFEMVRDRFDMLDEKLERHLAIFEEHVKEDKTYWKKVDERDVQLTLIQRLVIGLIALLGTVLGWFGFKH